MSSSLKDNTALSSVENWPPDYKRIYAWRLEQLQIIRSTPSLKLGAREYYKQNPKDFIEHWCDTYDPRNAGSDLPPSMPFILFDRQRELLTFFELLLRNQTSGLVEKSRDMGATWLACAFSVWLWCFWTGSSVGWGSRKEQLVDRLGDPDSIFEKMRMLIRDLPEFFKPPNFDERSAFSFMKIINRENGSTITGESGYDLGRGGRKLVYFKDESAHYERAEFIEAAVSECTNVQVDISSVRGVGNVFHRRRENGREFDGVSVDKDYVNVFVLDWKDHPAKDQAWYDRKHRAAERDCLLHIFEQEVDRKYGAMLLGTLIPSDWVTYCIDAHVALKWEEDPAWPQYGGLDVADLGSDTDACALRSGPILHTLKEWSGINTARTARHAFKMCRPHAPIILSYDSIGVGAGVRSEAEEMLDRQREARVTFTGWNGGGAVLDPDYHVLSGDSTSPKNKDFYENLKAQAWWSMRLRIEKTKRSIEAGINLYPICDMISISSHLVNKYKLQKELSQVVGKDSRSGKIMIDKQPSGTRSPNLADAVVICYYPSTATYTLENL